MRWARGRAVQSLALLSFHSMSFVRICAVHVSAHKHRTYIFNAITILHLSFFTSTTTIR